MKKQRIMMLTMLSLFVILFSTSLIVIGSYFLSKGFSSHILNGLNNILIYIVFGFILILGYVFFLFFVYLPRQREKRLEAIRNSISESTDKVSDR